MIGDPAVILVDMQKDYCKEGFQFDTPDRDLSSIEPTLAATGEFLERYRASGRDPILIQTLHDEASNSASWNEKYEKQPMPCKTGTEGAELVDELNVQESDVVVNKRRYSSFHNTELDVYLSSNDVSHVLIGGVNTNVCVASTVHGAFNRDYRVTILSDCTTTTQPKYHEPFLENFVDNNFGEVRDSSEIDLPSVAETSVEA